MSNKDIVRHFLEEVDRGNGVPVEFLTDGFVAHVGSDAPIAIESLKQINAMSMPPFPT